jgi:hypothetical protein
MGLSGQHHGVTWHRPTRRLFTAPVALSARSHLSNHMPTEFSQLRVWVAPVATVAPQQLSQFSIAHRFRCYRCYRCYSPGNKVSGRQLRCLPDTLFPGIFPLISWEDAIALPPPAISIIFPNLVLQYRHAYPLSHPPFGTSIAPGLTAASFAFRRRGPTARAVFVNWGHVP